MPGIPDDVRHFLEQPNFVHLATLLPDGSPHSVAVWGTIQDGKVAVFTQPSTQKAKNLERDARVAISVVDHENPYSMCSLRGRVVDTREGDAALEVMDRMARSYTGADFPVRTGVLYLIEIDRATRTDLPFEHHPQ